MREQTVALHCLLNDHFRARRLPGQRPPNARRHLSDSDAQVLATALVAARFFSGKRCLAQHYTTRHWGFKRLDKSGFARHLHRLRDELAARLATLGAGVSASLDPRALPDRFVSRARLPDDAQ